MTRSKSTTREPISYPGGSGNRDLPSNPSHDLRGSGQQIVVSPVDALAADPNGRFSRTIGVVPRLNPRNNRA